MTPTEKLSATLSKFAYNSGKDVSTVFDDFLRYIIHGFSLPSDKPLERWDYKDEDNRWFYNFLSETLEVVKSGIFKNGWYDVFGNIYEDVIASKSRRSNAGQFFTPESLCELMQELVGCKSEEKVSGKIIGDPTCGSGRTLLAHHAKNPGNFYVAEDLDAACVRMTIVNFLFHGVKGEVVWHDSLAIEPVYGVWRINPQINNPFSPYYRIPHIEPISWEDSWLKANWDKFQERTRIGGKLRENVVKLENRLKAFRSIKNPTEEIKAKITTLTKSVERINKLIAQSYSR